MLLVVSSFGCSEPLSDTQAPELDSAAEAASPGDDKHAVGNADIALSHFEPGNYKVQIRMTDKVKEETLTEEFEFVLKGESE